MLSFRKYAVLVVALIILVSLNVLINFEKGELVDKQAASFSKQFYKSNNKIINSHNYKYILNVDKDICMPSKKLTLLAMVPSASNNFENQIFLNSILIYRIFQQRTKESRYISFNITFYANFFVIVRHYLIIIDIYYKSDIECKCVQKRRLKAPVLSFSIRLIEYR